MVCGIDLSGILFEGFIATDSLIYFPINPTDTRLLGLQ